METKRVLALGFFDGVHLGHAALLKKARQTADLLHLPACAMSFDVHPETLVSGTEVALLSSCGDREWLMKSMYGIDEVIFAHFDEQMKNMPWETFIREYLCDTLHAAHVICGHDYRFGSMGEGTPELLKQTCEKLGIGCDIIPEVSVDGTPVSSTYIRTLLKKGDVGEAFRFLGHGHMICGTAKAGILPTYPGILLPVKGNYRGIVLQGRRERTEEIFVANKSILLPSCYEGPYRVFLIDRS